jgi:glycerol-3-phosphate dehydrogenase
MNLVVPRLPCDAAIGIPAPRKGQELDSVLDKGAVTYFIMPWGEYSLIGTKHLHCTAEADGRNLRSSDIEEFLGEINPVLGDQRIEMRDVVAVKHGLLPEEAGASRGGDVVLQKHSRIVDHETEDGIGGLISLVGVKWTTARLVAEKAVQKACVRLGKAATAPRPATGTLNGTLLQGNDSMRLVPDAAAAAADIVQAARNEMAVTLSDAVFRRTDLALSRKLDREELSRVAALMAAELRWSAEESERQLQFVLEEFSRRQAWRSNQPT